MSAGSTLMSDVLRLKHFCKGLVTQSQERLTFSLVSAADRLRAGVRFARKRCGMVRKIAAVWLLALAVSPFTAPFSTCDLPLLFSSHSPDTGVAPSGRPSSAVAASETPAVAAAEASAVAPLAARIRFVALDSPEIAPCPFPPRVSVAVSLDVPRFLRRPTDLSTTLRI